MVCMAVFMATSAQDLVGKMVGIGFPISMGFEHSAAYLFVLLTGILSGGNLSFADMYLKNLLAVTIGNFMVGDYVS